MWYDFKIFPERLHVQLAFYVIFQGSVNLVFAGAAEDSVTEDYTYKPKPEIQVNDKMR